MSVCCDRRAASSSNSALLRHCFAGAAHLRAQVADAVARFVVLAVDLTLLAEALASDRFVAAGAMATNLNMCQISLQTLSPPQRAVCRVAKFD